MVFRGRGGMGRGCVAVVDSENNCRIKIDVFISNVNQDRGVMAESSVKCPRIKIDVFNKSSY